MSRTSFSLDAEQVERLQKAMENCVGYAGRTINDVLHNEGAKLITEEIMRLLPASGRTWSGKKPAAKSAAPFTQQNGTLSVTILTKPAYHYLYFPDDGTNTKRHVGYKGKPREFMIGGAENQVGKIMDLCIERLIKQIGE